MADMTEKLRATVIALFPEGTPETDIREMIDRLAEQKALAGFQPLSRSLILSDGSKRSYAKFSQVIAPDALHSGLLLDVTRHLFDAGYLDVAWRLTRITTADEAENTTESFPVELFKAALADDAADQVPD